MLNVKPSRYNLIVNSQPDGNILLFNTFSTALGLFGKESQKFLKEGHYNTDKLSDSSRNIIKQLISMGFIVDHDLDELSRLELRENLARYGNRNLTLTIGPTMNCNMCCPYCFETKGNQSMTSETADKLIQFIKGYIEARKIESVNIVWYGGEPLLELGRIEQISEAIIPLCEEKNISYSAYIITNGYCLDQGSAELLKSLKVKFVQITIDGLEETHNARRRLKNGDGSFWTIVKNIDAIKNILPIIIRVNVDQINAQEIDALLDFFMDEMHWGKNPAFYLAPVEKNTDACGVNVEACLSPDDFSSLYQRMSTKIYEHGITEITHRIYPAYSEVGCAAICANNFVIDANGVFYTCWNHFGNISKSIGSLDKPNEIGLCGDYFNWLTIPIPEKCKECVYLPLCRAGCPDQRIKNKNNPVCRFLPRMYIENLKLAFRNHVAHK